MHNYLIIDQRWIHKCCTHNQSLGQWSRKFGYTHIAKLKHCTVLKLCYMGVTKFSRSLSKWLVVCTTFMDSSLINNQVIMHPPSGTESQKNSNEKTPFLNCCSLYFMINYKINHYTFQLNAILGFVTQRVTEMYCLHYNMHRISTLSNI